MAPKVNIHSARKNSHTRFPRIVSVLLDKSRILARIHAKIPSLWFQWGSTAGRELFDGVVAREVSAGDLPQHGAAD